MDSFLRDINGNSPSTVLTPRELGKLADLVSDEMKMKATATILTVTVKDDESTLRSKYLLYDLYTISEDDPVIKMCIDSTVEAFGKEPTDVIVKIQLEIK